MTPRLPWLGSCERIEAALSPEERAGLKALWADLGFTLAEWSRWPMVPPFKKLMETVAWKRVSADLGRTRGSLAAEMEAAETLGLLWDTVEGPPRRWAARIARDGRRDGGDLPGDSDPET